MQDKYFDRVKRAQAVLWNLNENNNATMTVEQLAHLENAINELSQLIAAENKDRKSSQ